MPSPAETDPPKLAPLGAGLPWLELKIAQLGFRWLSRRTSHEKAAALLAKECATVLELKTGTENGAKQE